MLSSMKSPNNRDKVRDNKKEIGLEMKRESFERFLITRAKGHYSDCHKRDLQENGS